MSDWYEQHRYGSARWATDSECPRAAPADHFGVFLGLDAQRRPLRHAGDAPLVTFAGSGAGKGRDVLMHNALAYRGSMLMLDPRGELAAVSIHNQVRLNKHAYCVNPARIGELPNHAVDPLDILKASSPTLHADAKMLAEMLQPLSGGDSAQYFELKAREIIEALLIADVEQDGKTSLPRLYRLANAVEGSPDIWLAFAEKMYASRYESVRRVCAELLTKQQQAPKEFGGIMGQLYQCLSFLNDPALLSGLEHPAFSLDALCDPARTCNVYLNVPVEYMGIWSPYLRVLIGVAMLYKQRRPDAPRVLYLIDEAAQLGRFEMLIRAITYGRGAGVRVWPVFQDVGQIARNYGREAIKTFIGSAQVRQFFGVRDLETAEMISRMLGSQTLSYDDSLVQMEARKMRHKAAQEFLRGRDPIDMVREYGYQHERAQHQGKQARPLATPDEMLSMPEDRQILFISGANCPPIAAWRAPYFEQGELAGQFMPNPYHPPAGRVRIPGWLGQRWARVITEPVPERFAHFPQYESGYWSFIEGHRPA